MILTAVAAKHNNRISMLLIAAVYLHIFIVKPCNCNCQWFWVNSVFICDLLLLMTGFSFRLVHVLYILLFCVLLVTFSTVWTTCSYSICIDFCVLFCLCWHYKISRVFHPVLLMQCMFSWQKIAMVRLAVSSILPQGYISCCCLQVWSVQHWIMLHPCDATSANHVHAFYFVVVW